METGDASRGAASLRGLASRRASGGSFLRAATGAAADPYAPAVLPDGVPLVLRSCKGAAPQGAQDTATRRSTTAAFKAFSAVKDFSRLTCLIFPEEAANAFCRMGYARVQLLLAYVLPEVLDEEWLPDEDISKPLEGEEASKGPPLHVPYRPYVVVSLNGQDVYRSAVLHCKPVASGDSTLDTALLRGLWDERIELQVHQPYSLLRVALYDRDISTAFLGSDELLGSLDFQLHLLMPRRIYDITAVFVPFAVLDEEALSGKEEAIALLQGTRQLHPSVDTRALLKESLCAVCGADSSCCKHGGSSSSGGDTDGALYTAELDSDAITCSAQQLVQQGDLGGCRMRLLLQLLPHRNADSGKIHTLDELAALLIPTPREAQESVLSPLNFPLLWADLQDAHRKLTEGALGVLATGLYDALYWERPVLSIASLLTFVFLWLHPQFFPAAFLFLLGMLLLIVSFIQMPPPPSGTEGGLRSEGAEAADASRGVGSSVGGGTGASNGKKASRPGSLKAFETAESKDCSEASLLRSLLSAAVPAPMQLRIRKFHIVGALWVLGAWAAVEPLEACSVARYLLLATG
ncbi:uncharacterized protein LOC34619928 [Cyclospora cayetanensis]|uniref:Uncharacterized protein LOC34619928 n=1 Tax=Cyclospora cayetanensis TaxID=88456 RepID=A0A6P6RRA6_9EIME|nr:uncharacterized protein LOC34619928 [Cyclospora cayetanensis]